MLAYLTSNGVIPQLLRILISCLCGLTIGLERTRRLKEAGVRTHCIIASTAALMMIISKYGFSDLIVDAEFTIGTRGADAARIAAQVVTGISFLCAGVIFRNGNSVRGLTTASGIWATSGVGMAIGAGMIPLGLGLAAIVIAIQVIFHHINIGSDVYSENDIRVIAHASADLKERFFSMAETKQLQIISYSFFRDPEGGARIDAVFRPKLDLSIRKTLEMFESIPEIISVSVNS